MGSRLGGGRDCRDCHLREAAAPASLTRRLCALYGIAFAILMPPGDAVFVHRERAEHIARALIGGGDVLVIEDALALPPRSRVGVTRQSPPQPRPLITEPRSTRWRDIVGLLGIVAGAAVFVAALAVPLDDPTLFLALVLALARHTYGRSSQTT